MIKLWNRFRNNVLNNMIKFQTDRNLHKKKFDIEVASLNIIEELLEAHGVKDKKDREYSKALYEAVKKQISYVQAYEAEYFELPSDYDRVDAFCDIAEFAIGEPLKMGYDTIKCLDQMQMEINSREGSIVDGKFTKDKSPGAVAKWYRADYSKCKL